MTSSGLRGWESNQRQTALGAVESEQRLDRGQGVQWPIDGYTLMFAALLVFAGSLSEGSGAVLVPSRSVLAAMSASPNAVGWVIMTPWRY